MYFQVGVRGLYTSLRSSSLIVQKLFAFRVFFTALRLSSVMVALFYSLRFVSICFEIVFLGGEGVF